MSRTAMTTRSRTSGTRRTRSYPKSSGRSQGTNYAEVTFSGFTGLNTKFSNTELLDTESPDCLNVEFDAKGAITKRNGYTLATSVASAVTSVLPFFTQSVNKLLLTFGTSITQYDPIANSSVTVTTTLTANGARFTSAMDTVHNKIYMVDGNSSDGLMSWDGTTFLKGITSNPSAWVANTAYTVNQLVQNGSNVYQCTTAGTSAASGGPTGTGASITDNTVVWAYVSAVGITPQGQYVLWYKNHLYIAGDSANPNRLYISDQGAPNIWPTLNFIDFDDGYGGIVGLKTLGDSIVVSKQFQHFILKGSDPSNYVVVDSFAGDHGTVAHWTTVQIPNGLLFLAHDGVYLFDGKKFTWVSAKIDIDNWNQAHLSGAAAFEYDQKYYLSVPEGTTQTTNNVTYVFNYVYGWWTKHSIGMNAAGLFFGNTEKPTPYFSDTSGKLFQLDSGGSDNGAVIDAYFVTRAFDFGSQAHQKRFKKVFVSALAEPGSYGLNVTFIQDFGYNQKTAFMPLSYQTPTTWGSFSWGAANWGGNGRVIHYTTTVPGTCRFLAIKFEGIGTSAPFTVMEIVAQYLVMERVT